MNKSIRYTAIFALLLTVALLINLTIVQVFKTDAYADNPLNKRGYLDMQQIPRGQITAANGVVLASSYPDAEGIYRRNYPYKPKYYGTITGYLSAMYGASDLEASYNAVLNGTDPALFAKRIKDLFKNEDRSGANVETTIIPEVQETAYNALVNNGYSGGIVAIRPSTGEILAMASTPGYDPNSIVDAESSSYAWEQLNADPQQPLLNLSAQETVPPGSIFKIITTAAGLHQGYNAKSTLTGQAAITLPNTESKLTNYGGATCGNSGGGPVTLETAFAYSCNTAFVEMGLGIGEQELRDAADAFGIGQDYDIGIPTSPGELGEIEDQAALGQTAIGQRDTTMSVLQAAVMAATIANGGQRMEPHLVKQITKRDLTVLQKIEPKKLNDAVDSETARDITKLMIASERNTYGYAGQDIASKTGTAEHGDGSEAPHTWYVAFGPTQNADVAVAVLVKNGGGAGASATGGKIASPIGRDVLQTALKYM